MKISIGAKIFDKPWGGGNLFVKNLSEYLVKNGHKVVFDLLHEDIDIILLTDPRKSSYSSNFNHKDIINYLQYVNSHSLVLHRINECDERKNTNGLNKFFVESNKCADRTIFVSQWLQDLYEKEGLYNNNLVIMSGSDSEIFNGKNKAAWENKTKLKFVTHHWGDNWNKGFDIYLELDNLLDQKKYSEKIEFTYIGNLPKNFEFRNAYHIEPTHGKQLAELLKNNHIYITASKNEPSGNHHIEASQCGLPVLYLNSGGIPEFCNGYGLMFEENNFEKKLNEIINNYKNYEQKMNTYPFNAEKMCKEYLDLFLDMKKYDKEIVEERADELNYLLYSKFIFQIKRKLNKYVNKSKLLKSIFTLLNRIYLKLKSIIVK